MAKNRARSSNNSKHRRKAKAVVHKRQVPLKRIFPAGQRALYANSFAIQHEEANFHFLFFQANPPLLLKEGDEAIDELNEIKELDAECIARIIVPAHLMPAVIGAIQDNFQKQQLKVSAETKTIDLNDKGTTIG